MENHCNGSCATVTGPAANVAKARDGTPPIWGRRCSIPLTRVIQCLVATLLLAASTPQAGFPVSVAGPAEQAVREFYDSIGDKRCARAVELRTHYDVAQCLRISDVEIRHTALRYSDERVAVVFVDVAYTESGRPGDSRMSFTGLVTLRRDERGWIIDGGSYRSRLALAEYLRQVAGVLQIPAGSTAASDTRTAAYPATRFGSGAVLENLWSRAALRGAPEDRRIRRVAPPDTSPPERVIAVHALPALGSPLRGSIRRVQPADGEKLVALSFDLCERADERTGYDYVIVDYLRDQGIKATFFAGGKWMRSHPEQAMQLMADPLFEVGNHAWTHGNLRVLQGKRMQEQILWTQAQHELLWERLLARARPLGIPDKEMHKIPAVPSLFRFPYGTCDREALGAVADAGLAAIQWDVVSGDAVRGMSSKAVVRNVLQGVRPGSIVLFHANARGHGTAEALPTIVTRLQQAGYRFLTVSELLRAGQPVAVDQCYELRPGDNRHYDAIYGEGTGGR